MQLTRRTVGALAVGGLTGLAGCSQGPLTFSAEAAVTSTSGTEYERTGQRKPTLSREFAGQKVKVTNVVTEYQKKVDLALTGSAKLGVFVAFATPKVEVAGKTFNPVGDWSTKKLVKKLQSRYNGLKDVQKVGTQQVDCLGSSRTVTKFSAKASYDGKEVPVYLLVAKFPDGSDFVVPIGVYPQKKESESENIKTLMNQMSHPPKS